MIKIKPYMGLALIIIGAILLLLSYPTGLSHVNFVLLTGLTFIVLGLGLYVWQLKRDSKY